MDEAILTSELQYEQRLIAFIDILGFKEIVKESENDSTKIELLDSVLEYLKDWEISEKWNQYCPVYKSNKSS